MQCPSHLRLGLEKETHGLATVTKLINFILALLPLAQAPMSLEDSTTGLEETEGHRIQDEG